MNFLLHEYLSVCLYLRMTWTDEGLDAANYDYQHCSEFVAGRDARTHHAAHVRNQECRCRIVVTVLGNRHSKSLTRPQRSEPAIRRRNFFQLVFD